MIIDRFNITGVTHDGFPLQIHTITIEEAETWSPYVRGNITCVYKPQLFNGSLDPRNAFNVPTVDVLIMRNFGDAENSHARYTAEVGSPVSMAKRTALTGGKMSHTFAKHWNGGPVSGEQLSLRLAVDEISADLQSGTMRIEFGGDELRLQDAAIAEPRQLTGRTYRYVLNDLLSQLNLGSLVSGGNDPVDAPIWRAGQTALDFVDGMFEGSGKRLIYDHSGKWRVIDLETDDYDPGEHESWIELAAMIKNEITFARRDWHDSVAITWKWEVPDPSDPDRMIERQQVEWGGYTTRQRPLLLERVGPPPPTNNLSNYLAEREWRRGQKHSLSLPMNLTMHPLQNFTVGDDAAGRRTTLTRVSRSFPESTMQIETRERII